MKKTRSKKGPPAAKLIAFCLAAFVCSVAPSVCFAADAESAQRIRIGLAYGTAAPASCEIASASGFILTVPKADGFSEGMPLPAYTRLTVAAEGGRTTLHADGVLVSDDIGAETCIMPYDYASGTPILYNGVPYRGGLSFRPNAGNTFNVINLLTVEEYLYGLVNAEMGYKNPAEALKAQAVTARSYAASKMNAHGDDGFDMCATAHCQVYRGYADERAETAAAVNDTAGLMLYHDGVLVSGNYFKNSGGHTQNSEDVWSSAEPWLRGVPDEHSPPYAWGWQISFRELRALLAAAGEDPGEVASVSIGARNADGSVRAVTVQGDRGTVSLEKNRIRTVLGASNVKSLRFAFNGAPPSLPQAPEIRVAGADGEGRLADGVFVLSADEFGAFYPSDAVIQGATERARVSDLLAETGGERAADAPVTGGSLTFTGAGYGHGVGMPQDSAIEMAKLGFDFRGILTKYFTGAEIR